MVTFDIHMQINIAGEDNITSSFIHSSQQISEIREELGLYSISAGSIYYCGETAFHHKTYVP